VPQGIIIAPGASYIPVGSDKVYSGRKAKASYKKKAAKPKAKAKATAKKSGDKKPAAKAKGRKSMPAGGWFITDKDTNPAKWLNGLYNKGYRPKVGDPVVAKSVIDGHMMSMGKITQKEYDAAVALGKKK